MSELGLNFLFLKRLCKVLSSACGIRTPAFLLLLLTIPVCVLEQVGYYYMGLIPSGFYKVLEDRDKQGFYHQLWVACWWVLAIVLIKSCKSYAAGALYIQWRWNLTGTLHDRYLRNKLYYDINCLRKKVDNPDMRITQDVDRLVDTLHSIILQLVVFPGVVVYYTYKCWTTMGYLGPVCIYSYFLISCVCNQILMSPIVREVFRLERREGHFRYMHVNFRSLAESAAFSDAELTETSHFRDTLKLILQSKQTIVNKQLFLNCAVNACDYLGSILSYMILAIPIFGGVYDGVDHLGSIISQNSFVAMYLVNTFSSMVDLSSKIADLAAYTHRVGELLELLNSSRGVSDGGKKQLTASTGGGEGRGGSDDLDDRFSSVFSSVGTKSDFINTVAKSSPSKDSTVDGTLVRLTNVTIQNPLTNKSLVRSLSLSIDFKTNIQIQGPPGAGKSSILRTIKSLWEPLAGTIVTNERVLYLPQRPYFTRQSVAQQVTLPELVTEDTDLEEVMGILNRLELGDVLETIQWEEEQENESRGLLEGCCGKWCHDRRDGARQEYDDPSSPLIDEKGTSSKISTLNKTPQRGWYKSLSPGKQQLLAFSRVLYHKPSVVVMDEPMSALSPLFAKLIYGILREMGICYLSVSHNPAWEIYHDKVIVITGDGENWNFRDADSSL